MNVMIIITILQAISNQSKKQSSFKSFCLTEKNTKISKQEPFKFFYLPRQLANSAQIFIKISAQQISNKKRAKMEIEKTSDNVEEEFDDAEELEDED